MKKLLILVSFAIFVLASCGGDSSGSPKLDFHKDQFKVQCQKAFSCEQGESMRGIFGGSLSECEKLAKYMEEEAIDDCPSFDSAAAKDCIKCLKNQTCAQYFSDYDWDDLNNDGLPKDYEPCTICSLVCG
ncbi:MAG: hypothetical protein ACOX2F_09080 [bacterium]